MQLQEVHEFVAHGVRGAEVLLVEVVVGYGAHGLGLKLRWERPEAVEMQLVTHCQSEVGHVEPCIGGKQ